MRRKTDQGRPKEGPPKRDRVRKAMFRRVSEVRQIEVWREIVPVVEPVKVIEICLVQERLTPYEIANESKSKERAGTDDGEPHSPKVDQTASLRKGGDTAEAINHWVNLPMGRDAEANSC